MAVYRRFPREKTKHLQSVGKILVRILDKILLDLGFGVWVNPQPRNGVDMEVYDEKGILVLAIEVLNWSQFSWMYPERVEWIIENLTSYKCRRLLVYTAMSEENYLENLSDYSISVVKIGYQVLTEKIYKFYEARNQVIGRKINNRTVKRDIKQKMLEYLESLDIHP